ncbi:Arm DNA-binding domain-containing protein [Microbulbifer taiwanensis]|uniref:Arm DNA-binding domain-containing protein n=1 Tax=Microbulbifer taiwanensis TaxID=986746 RepID=UPI003670A78D
MTDHYLRNLKPKASGRYKVWDTDNPRLVVDVLASGKKVFRAYYLHNGKPKFFTIGPYGTVTLAQARKHAGEIHSKTISGSDPIEEKRQAAKQQEAAKQQAELSKQLVLKTFLEEVYEPWAREDQGLKSVSHTLKNIQRDFSWLLDQQMDSLQPEEIDKWKKRELERGYQSILLTAASTHSGRPTPWHIRNDTFNLTPEPS